MAEEYVRARSPEHKAERYAQIMAAADELFHELPYQEITPTAIARRLGWTRSNLYKYASTKEEVYLSLYLREQEAFCRDLALRLDVCEPTPVGVARAWASAVDAHRDCVRYRSVLVTVLETNVGYGRLVEAKRSMRENMLPAIEALDRALPTLGQAGCVGLYLALAYHAMGLRGHYLGTKDQLRAMDEAGMGRPTGTFAEANERFALTYLHGLLGGRDPSPGA